VTEKQRAQLKAARVKCGLTLVAAAERAGISHCFWQWVETGRKTPSLPTLERMAAAVGLAVEVRLRRARPQ
jgi:transcriptional regulator with XRE-family HTH domain